MSVDRKEVFKQAFKRQEAKLSHNMEKVKRYREALEAADNSSGWDVPRTASGLVLLASLVELN